MSRSPAGTRRLAQNRGSWVTLNPVHVRGVPLKQSHRVAGRATLAALAATIVAFCLAPSAATAAGTLVAEPEEVDFGAVEVTATVEPGLPVEDPAKLVELG